VTLMEILMVIAIIGILIATAYPSYERSKLESRRTDATGALIATQGIVQRYLAENNKVLFDSTDLSLSQFANYSTSSGTPKLSKNGAYVITIAPDSTGYIVSATATATGALNDCTISANTTTKQCSDTLCRIISIDHGANESTDSSGVVSNAQATQCW